jgi:ribonucleoside-diphosphate reductase alpha chain
VQSIGEKNGFRNAQASVLAPTGTIGFMMDCDTTGIEPDFSLVKFKKLVGGGSMQIVNQTIPRALRKLGYQRSRSRRSSSSSPSTATSSTRRA